MILVLLGTQNYSFKRLLDAVDMQIKKGNIKDKVIVQAGYTKYESNDMEIFTIIPNDKLIDLIKKANLIITHGGVGSIMEGLINNKKIIVAGRLKKYNEAANDHQLQIIEQFKQSGYILSLDNFNELDKTLEIATNFQPSKYKSNTDNMIKLIEEYINYNY